MDKISEWYRDTFPKWLRFILAGTFMPIFIVVMFIPALVLLIIASAIIGIHNCYESFD